MENYFRGFSVKHIERARNTEADKLVNAAARKITLPPDVFFLNTGGFLSKNS
jgi:hypothetical protein